MTLARDLSKQSLDRIVEQLGLREVPGPDGGPLLAFGPLGTARVWEGPAIDRLVAIHLMLPPIGLDSHMLFAFSKKDSVAPHFTIDAVKTGDAYALHIDLVPRADLAANLPYMDAAFAPLTGAFERYSAVPGLSPAQLSPRQRALMSPWMLAFRADEGAFEKMFDAASIYREHWLELLGATLPAPTVTEDRDRRMRAALFSPEVDPVWTKVERMIGAEASARARSLLIGTAS
jgi:hypothetical protein